jgi:crotonobetainyl-CoA:carnitine CoA-transferase CaiB-like acyl-CoA transferase
LAKVADRDQLRSQLTEIFAARSLAEWVEALAGVDTCFAPVNTLEEALDDPQVRELGLFTSVDHARLGSLPQISPAFAFSETRASVRSPSPELGEHTEEILGELGLNPEDVRSLAERRVI